ncbi:MAG: hypothetical protein ACLQA5_15315 [Solirubrobacteraceae bacterium]
MARGGGGMGGWQAVSAELAHLGIAVYGPRRAIARLTGSLPLLT